MDALQVKRQVFLLLLTIASTTPISVIAQAKYFIEFKDKQNTTYSVDRPNEFLSARAIERRQRQGIAIATNDLPVSTTYMAQVAQIATKIHYPLRWFNGVVATLTPEQLTAIQELSCVKSVTKIFEPIKGTTATETDWGPHEQNPKTIFANLNYGPSFTQVAMMNGHLLHANGYFGQEKVIAVLDAGFLNVNTHNAFDSLWQRGRILGARDFVNPQSDIYQEHYHGTMVLSAMGGYIDGQLIGTAPRAKYWLIRTEDAATEQIIEEYNWAAGAEFADSVGADIINSSLGYTTFDVASQNHTYQDMNGNTAPVTLAANMAASKGMVVVVSAGNDGNSPWHYISAPADSPHVLTVGAVDNNKVKADFSSFGPTSDGRVKPDVCAMGKGTVLAIATGTTGTSNGTSFSSPLMAGMVACLWQAKLSLTAQQIVELVKSSSSNYTSPDNGIGYGIPDFALASISSITDSKKGIEIWPNPFTSKINIHIGKSFMPAKISIFTINGQLIHTEKAISDGVGQIEINVPVELPKGIYILSILTTGNSYYATGIK